MAHKKGVGSSKNGRESESKRLGVKIYGGQAALAGNIIYAKEELNTTLVITFIWEKIIHYTLELMVLFNSKKEKTINHMFLLIRLRLRII